MSNCNVTISGKIYTCPEDITFAELIHTYFKEMVFSVILVKCNGKLQELHKKVSEDCEVEFVTTSDPIGFRTYCRSVVFLMFRAFADELGDGKTCPVRMENSLSHGRFCTIRGIETVDEALLAKVEKRMRALQEAELPICKSTISGEKARQLFAQREMMDKAQLFRFRQASTVNVYSLGDYCDYFYGYMAHNTAGLKWFKLYPYMDGFVLQMPVAEAPQEVPEFEPQEKLCRVLSETRSWNSMMQVETVADLNTRIAEGKINELILLQEALQEKKIGDIAETIANKESVRFVLIAGPSSSGKTSFANRLSIQLRTQGMIPHIVSVDNYYKDRDDIPRDSNGQFDFECLEALDVDLLNEHLKALLNGEEIHMPKYSFGSGSRTFREEGLRMEKQDILVIEGIHCLNDQLTYDIPAEKKFKIYISALTQLNIDFHNRIPTTDGRLLRRMARDSRTRNTTPQETIRMWPSVRRGEEENIFPYQEQADVMFNSAMIYELPLLKQNCEPILYTVPEDSPEFLEAKRLLKFLEYFLDFSSDLIPRNSIVREFAGGSCFDV